MKHQIKLLFILLCNILLLTYCSTAKNDNNLEIDKPTGTAEIRTSTEIYNYAKSIGFEVVSTTIDSTIQEVQFKNNYVVLGRNDYPIGLHNIQYGINTTDSTYIKTISNFPIHNGETTIYYDNSFLVDVKFDIIIDPSYDREYTVDLNLH